MNKYSRHIFSQVNTQKGTAVRITQWPGRILVSLVLCHSNRTLLPYYRKAFFCCEAGDEVATFVLFFSCPRHKKSQLLVGSGANHIIKVQIQETGTAIARASWVRTLATFSLEAFSANEGNREVLECLGVIWRRTKRAGGLLVSSYLPKEFIPISKWRCKNFEN